MRNGKLRGLLITVMLLVFLAGLASILYPYIWGAAVDSSITNTAIIDYVENPEKTDNGKLITSWQCDSRGADSEFLFSKQQYIRNTGRVRGADDVIAYHLRQSFRPGEITPEEANRLGCELAQRFTKGNHAYIVCTHIDKAHVHNHIIWNSTALDEQRKFRNFWGSTRAVRRLNDTICVENGYSIVADPKGKGQTYDKWLGNQKKPSHRERICYAIDEALAQKPQSFDELLELLRQSGYQIKGGKVPSLLGENQKRFIRMDTLGENYTPDALRAIVSGARRHTPKKKRSMDISAKPSGSLLIDIQAKLQEGKGAGYARWAKNFNLKQLSQTLIYLEENGLLDRGILEERTATATSRYRTLSTDIKAKEQRIAEIKIMQQHIINYAKTRNVYVAYRKAGYSKKFLAEHESEIILHKAAKQFFDEQGLKKLPTVKSLQAEYTQLLSEKKAIYADYQKARDEMRSLQTAKANVDRILGEDALPVEREPEKDGR